MPRGNDKQTQDEALAELAALADSFSEGVGNAEELINANARRRTTELAALGNLPVLYDETAELDLDDLEGPNGETVVDASVRGAGRTRGTIVVYEDGRGDLHKHLAELVEAGGGKSGPRRSSHVKPDDDKGDGDAGEKAAPKSRSRSRSSSK